LTASTLRGAPRVAAASVDPAALVPWLLRVSGPDPLADDIDLVPVDHVERLSDGGVRMTGVGRLVAVVATWTRLAEDGRAWSIAVEATLEPRAAEPLDATVAVAVEVPADGDPQWLVPAVFYGANRPAESRASYPRWVASPVDAGMDRFAAADWWFRADRAATPAVFASGGGLRVAIATTELSPVGMTGVGFGTVMSDGGERRQVRLSFPYREEPVVYDGSSRPQPSDRPTVSWEPGATIRLEYRVHVGDDAPQASTPILRSLRRRLAADAPLQPWVSSEEAATLAADGLLRWHYRADDGVLIETAAFDRRGDGTGLEPGDRRAMHVGWLSGAPTAFALFEHGNRVDRTDAVDAGTRVLDEIAANLAPCGTFWGQWSAADGWGKGWTPGPDVVHARTLGEAALFMARAVRRAGPHGRSAWNAAVASNVGFVANAQRGDGAIPTAWNARTGEAVSWAGSAGLAWVPGLIEAAGLGGDDALHDAARRLGRYHARAVEAEFLIGAPEDVDLGPTSEDGYVAIMAYVALASAAASEREHADWLELARHAADWTLSFRFVYNVTFGADTVLGRADFRTRGADLASPANQHLHGYGLICTAELLELSRLSGDPRYREAAAETYACFRQFIARHDGDFGARRGMAPERFYQTRYDGEKGGIGPLSHAWCLGLLLHASEVAASHPEVVIDA
jgi:hypothetical protein